MDSGREVDRFGSCNGTTAFPCAATDGVLSGTVAVQVVVAARCAVRRLAQHLTVVIFKK